MSKSIPLMYSRLSDQDQLFRARQFYEQCNVRRTVREFSPEPIPAELLELIVRTAGTAPSGANKQPWRFVIVSDPSLKHAIRLAAEVEEQETYQHRMPEEWRTDLAPLGTDWHKPFLEEAPALIVLFALSYDIVDGERRKHYYVKESVGIAAGFLLAAIHNAGLVTVTHTPSPMDFLGRILERPENEKAFLLMPVGYPKESTMVPDIKRKELDEILIWK